MDQPNVLENIFKFLDGKDLFNVRQVCIFWRDVCEYVLKKSDYFECKWYQTHLVFLDSITNDKSLNLNKNKNGLSGHTQFLLSCGVLMKINEIIDIGKNNQRFYTYELRFYDYLKSEFGYFLFENQNTEMHFVVTESFDMKSIKLFIGRCYNYSDYEYDIEFLPNFRIHKLNGEKLKDKYQQYVTRPHQFVSPDVSISTDKNDFCKCQNDPNFSIKIAPSEFTNIFNIEFLNTFPIWMRIQKIGPNQYTIARSLTLPVAFYFEFDATHSKLVKIKDYYFGCKSQYVYCPFRKQVIQFKFKKGYINLIGVAQFSELSSKKPQKVKSPKTFIS